MADLPRDITFVSRLRFGKEQRFNSALFALRPSSSTFESLVQRAEGGQYIPIDNSEQDILNMHFPPDSDTTDSYWNLDELLPHEAWCSSERSPFILAEHCLRENDPLLISRMAGARCEDFWDACVT